MTEYKVQINGIDVIASYSSREVTELFIPMLKMLTEKQQALGKRILVLLAAPPGAGKSTLASFLEHLSRTQNGLCPIQTIGMDGFHRRQDYLLSHMVIRDGKEVSMVEIKGAPVTFDLDHLLSSVRKIAAGEKIGWPIYDRLLHNPVENAIIVDEKIVLIEGNYLLLDKDGWRDLHGCADYSIFVNAGEKLLRERLITRRVSTGVTEDMAARFVDFSDMANVRLCLTKTLPADLCLRLNEAGEYIVENESNSGIIS